MPTTDVLPPALVSAAAAVRCFTVDLEPVAVRADALASDVLGSALAVFGARWGQALADLAEDAGGTATALREAAVRYAEIDGLLLPSALR